MWNNFTAVMLLINYRVQNRNTFGYQMTATVSLLENDGNYFPLSVYET